MKNNNLVKILIIISVLLAMGFIAVSAKLISLEKAKDQNPTIVDNKENKPSSESEKPQVIKPPVDSEPEKGQDEEGPIKVEDEIVVTKYLSVEKAIEIAVSKVGSGARVVEVDTSLDDNPPKYEVELILGAYEYEVEIHAITGAIIDFDKDDLD